METSRREFIKTAGTGLAALTITQPEITGKTEEPLIFRRDTPIDTWVVLTRDGLFKMEDGTYYPNVYKEHVWLIGEVTEMKFPFMRKRFISTPFEFGSVTREIWHKFETLCTKKFQESLAEGQLKSGNEIPACEEISSSLLV